MNTQKSQAIIEAEKSIISFFISLDKDKFNEEARKKFAKKFHYTGGRRWVGLSAREYDRIKTGNRGGRL